MARTSEKTGGEGRRGGRRAGAGRPRGSGRYGEPTTPLRVPESLVPRVRAWIAAGAEADRPRALPLYGSRVAAGFPSPADEHLESRLDLNEHLVRRPEATFFVRVSGDSMIGAGIHDGDLLVVDRAVEPADGKVVIAVLDGELTVKRLRLRGGRARLVPENDRYPAIEAPEEGGFDIWGVVTAVVHAL